LNSERKSKNKKAHRGLFYNFCYDFVKVTGAIPALLWLRPKVYRPYKTKIPKGGVMVTANHSTMIDPIIMHLAIPSCRMHSLATKDLFNTKLKRTFFELMHCVIVDKDNFTMSDFREVVSLLSEGKMVVIFPEGSVDIYSEDNIRAFKSGAVLMAHKAGAPILPVYIVRRTRWYERQRVVIGEPFDVRAEIGERPSLEDMERATAMLHERELALREYFESLPIFEKLQKRNEKQRRKR
jgi:1-acyl-sn-glycerol-3-phosphate acyltransferase